MCFIEFLMVTYHPSEICSSESFFQFIPLMGITSLDFESVNRHVTNISFAYDADVSHDSFIFEPIWIVS